MAQCHDEYEFRYRPGPVQSVTGTQCHDLAADPVVDTDLELVLARVVRDWVQTVDPGDEGTARCAVQAAVAAFAAGASVPEACESARKLVFSRLNHPSYTSSRPPASQAALTA